MLAKIKTQKDQEKLIAYLRDKGFKFITLEFLKENSKVSIKEAHEDYQFMVKLVETEKSSRIMKIQSFDYSLVFAIKILGKKRDKIHIYQNNSFYSTLHISWPEIEFNMKKKTILQKFPSYMTILERKRWRHIDKKVREEKVVLPIDLEFHVAHSDNIKKLNINR